MSKKRKKYALNSAKIMEKRKPSRYPLVRCRGCQRKYYAVEKDAKTGEVLRIIACWNSCFFTQGMESFDGR